MNTNLIIATCNLLNQLGGAIEQTSADDFKKPSPVLNQSSIGQHVRHTLEFFLCLIDSLPTGNLDYDNRKHDKFIEEDKGLALRVLNDIKEFVQKNNEDFPLQLTVNYDLESAMNSTIQSNFYRELAYNIEHAIHHMALIKIGIKDVCPYVNVDSSFGVASSTIRYQKQVG